MPVHHLRNRVLPENFVIKDIEYWIILKALSAVDK
jgi:hypothetical protein